MANIFDQFDQPAAAAASPGGANIFDQFDPPSPGARPGLSGGQLTLNQRRQRIADLEAEQAQLGEQPGGTFREFAEPVTRPLGLAGRDVAVGLSNVAGIVTNPIAFSVNEIGKALGFDPQQSTDLAGDVNAALTQLGVPNPESAGEQIVSRINQAVVGGGGFIGLGRAVASQVPGVAGAVGEALATAPRLQGVSAATGQAAVEALPEDAGAGATIATQLAGSVLPGGLAATGQAVVRGAARGRTPEAIRQNIQTFENIGGPPSVGAATGGRGAQALEASLERIPGSAGPLVRSGQQTADAAAQRVRQVADDLVPQATAEKAGRSIERGVGKFVDDFTDRARGLYDEVDVHIPQGTTLPLTRTQTLLDEVALPVSGAEKTSDILSSNFLTQVRESLGADIAQAIESRGVAGLPYEAVKGLRTLVGERINSSDLITDVGTGQLKRLYGALSSDLETMAAGIGEDALQSTRRANNFYRAGRGRIEDLQRVISRNGGPEKVFNAATSGTREGATTLRTVMKSLPPEGRDTLTAAMVRRLGLANPGQQNAAGDAFSMSTYLTNWSKISPEARSVLFGRQGPEFQKNMDELAKSAELLRQGAQVFSNPSGTAQAVIGGASLLAPFFSGSISAGLSTAGTIAGVAGSANLASRLMTNRSFIRFLAEQTTTPAGSIAAQINSLAQLARNTGDRDLALAAGVLKDFHLPDDDSVIEPQGRSAQSAPEVPAEFNPADVPPPLLDGGLSQVGQPTFGTR